MNQTDPIHYNRKTPLKKDSLSSDTFPYKINLSTSPYRIGKGVRQSYNPTVIDVYSQSGRFRSKSEIRGFHSSNSSIEPVQFGSVQSLHQSPIKNKYVEQQQNINLKSTTRKINHKLFLTCFLSNTISSPSLVPI